MTGEDLAQIVVAPPGPKSRRLAKELRDVESRNVTFVSDEFPVFFESGAGANLKDVDGNVYVDLSGAFAVAAAGHSNPRVAAAVGRQAAVLMHGMGDVHPNPLKVQLARTLCKLAPGDGAKRVIFATSGAEAVEAAIKTAAVATGKPGVLCFTGAYMVSRTARLPSPIEACFGRRSCGSSAALQLAFHTRTAIAARSAFRTPRAPSPVCVWSSMRSTARKARTSVR